MGETTGWAARVKGWAEAAAAGFKACLYGAAFCLTFAAAVSLLWREETTRGIVVDVSKDAESALTRNGGDVDLRLALQDALNERLQGVQRIIAVQGLSILPNDADAQSVSFKPFGVELTTDEVTKLTDLLINRPPKPAVRLELQCSPGACFDPGSRPGSLIATVMEAGGSHRAGYPLEGGNAGLRRSLRQAIQAIADQVMAQSEPSIASVWFLNHGLSKSVSVDQVRLELSRAVGSAFAARPHESAKDCVSDLVIG